MTDRPPSVPGTDDANLRIELFPPDLDAFVAFWTEVLGFVLERDERASPSPYVALRRGAVRVGAAPGWGEDDRDARRPPTGAEIVLEVADVVGERDRVARLWPLEEDLLLRPWGLRDFRVLDPAGHYVRLTGGPAGDRRGE